MLRAVVAIAILFALVSSAPAAPKRAKAAKVAQETVETDISDRDIAIESNFTGTEIVVFGTVLQGSQEFAEDGSYDLAVVIRGPEKSVMTREKSRVLGIWINTRARAYPNVPGYYAVLSTRPLDEIAETDILEKYGIGFDSVLLERTGPGDPGDPFRDAIIRINTERGLYRSSTYGVSFIGKSLFRATVTLPATVPVGEYWADVFVFSDGKMLSHSSSSLTIHKVGFERVVYTMAFDYPLLYGLVAVAVAVLAGLLASAVFRRD